MSGSALQNSFDAAGAADNLLHSNPAPPPSAVTPDLQSSFAKAGAADDAMHQQPDSGVGSQIAAGLSGSMSQIGQGIDTALAANPVTSLAQRGINWAAGQKTPTLGQDVMGNGQIASAVPQAVQAATGVDPSQVRTSSVGNAAIKMAAGMAPFGISGPEEAGLGVLSKIAKGAWATGKGMLGQAAVGAGAGAIGQEAENEAPAGNIPGTSIPYKTAAGMGAGLLGGAGVAGALHGAGALGNAATSSFKGGAGTVEQQAVEELLARARNPEALKTALAQPATPNQADPWAAPIMGQIVPGSQPTLGQLAPGAGLTNAEATFRKSHSEPFQVVEQGQNAARVNALQGVEPPGLGADTVGQHFRNQLDQIDQTREALNNHVSRTMEALGGPGAPGDLEDAQTAARSVLLAADKRLGDAEDAVWNRTKQQYGSLPLDGSPVGTAAREIANSPEANPDNLGSLGSLKPIIDTLSTWGPDEDLTFDRARVVRSNITKALEGIRNSPDMYAPQTRSRLMQLKTALDSTMQEQMDAADTGVRPNAPPAAAGPPALQTGNTTAPNVGGTVYTPAGRQMQVEYGLMPGSDLVTSHNQDMTPNPAYPQELQPRDRTRAASNVQVQKIAGDLHPEQLGASASYAEGAPIVGPDNVVESGNARALAIQRAYNQNPDSANRYLNYLRQNGYPEAQAGDVLVRRRTSPMTPEERVASTREGGASSTMPLSATEQAASDAAKIPDESLSLIQPGPVDSAGNRPFIRAFAKNVLSPGEENAFVTSDGSLSMEGAQRVRSALLHRAYGDPQLVSALTESGDENIKAFGGALTDAAGPVAMLERDIKAGDVDPNVAIAKPLRDAAQAVSQARVRKLRLGDYLGQSDAFNTVSPQAEGILRLAFGQNFAKRLSRAKLSDAIEFMASEASEQQATGRLFGENLGFNDILGEAERRYGQSSRAAQAAPPVSARARPGLGESGAQARGLGNGQTGPGAPAGGEGTAQPIQPILERRRATPSELAGLHRDYGEAKATTRNNPFNNPRGPAAQSIAPGPYGGGFAIPNSQLIQRWFHGGKNATEDAAELVRTVGREEAVKMVGQEAVAQLRAKFPTGQFDDKTYQQWAAKHAAALNVFPEVRQAFDQPAAAQAMLRQVREATESAAVKKVLGADPDKMVAQIVGKRNSQQLAADITHRVSSNPDALSGWRRALVDHLLTGSKALAEGPAGEAVLNAGKFHTAFMDNEGVYSVSFTPRQMNVLRSIDTDLVRQQQATGGATAVSAAERARELRALKETKPSMFGAVLNAAGKTGAVVAGGLLTGGLEGGILGKFVSDAMEKIGVTARASRTEQVSRLVADMLADPREAAKMFETVPQRNVTTLTQRVTRALARGAPSLAAQTNNSSQ